MWLLAKRLRKLSMEEQEAAHELPELIDGPDLCGAPRVQLRDADGDVADEFWEERPCLDGGTVLEEARTPGALSLALVPGDDSLPSSLVHAGDQVRQELALRSVGELKGLLERSGAGSFGLIEKSDLIERILQCVTSMAAELPSNPLRSPPGPAGPGRPGSMTAFS